MSGFPRALLPPSPPEPKAKGFWDKEFYSKPENKDWKNPDSKGGPTHTFERREVEKIDEFCGWPTLLKLVDECGRAPYYDGGRLYFGEESDLDVVRERLRLRDRALVCVLFETGCRVLEALSLKRLNFNLDTPGQVDVTDCSVLKRFKKHEIEPRVLKNGPDEVPTGKYADKYHWSPVLGKWSRRRFKTEKVWAKRAFSFDADEPLVGPILTWFEVGKDGDPFEPDDLLFPSSKTRKGEVQSMTATHAFRIIRDASMRAGIHEGYYPIRKVKARGVWPHWLRSQRASMLGDEGKLTKEELDRWFAWADNSKTSSRYSHIGTDSQLEKMKAA